MLTLFSNQILGNVVGQVGLLLWGQRGSIFNSKALLENLRYVILIAIGVQTAFGTMAITLLEIHIK